MSPTKQNNIIMGDAELGANFVSVFSLVWVKNIGIDAEINEGNFAEMFGGVGLFEKIENVW